MTTELRDIGNSTIKLLLNIKWTLKGESPGGTPNSLGGGVPLRSQKSYPFTNCDPIPD